MSGYGRYEDRGGYDRGGRRGFDSYEPPRDRYGDNRGGYDR